jgi:hypothetical protein
MGRKKKSLFGGNTEKTEEVIVETVITDEATLIEDSVVEEETLVDEVEEAEEVIEEDILEEIEELEDAEDEVAEEEIAPVIEEEVKEEEVVVEAPVVKEAPKKAKKKVAEKRAKKTATAAKIKSLLTSTDRPIQAEKGTTTVTSVRMNEEAVTVLDLSDGSRLIVGNSATIKTVDGEVVAKELEAHTALVGGLTILNVNVTEYKQYVVVPTTTKGNFAAANGVVITSGGLMKKSAINLF